MLPRSAAQQLSSANNADKYEQILNWALWFYKNASRPNF